MSDRGTGALPPPDQAWQMGKTAASIMLVREIEGNLGTHADLLDRIVAALKAGTLVANDKV